MKRMVHRFPTAFFDDDGGVYDIRIMGEPNGHVWYGWIEYASRDGFVMKTDRETTQPSLEDLVYWAEGLEPLYFEGAFARAQRHSAPEEAPGRGPG